MLTQEQVFEMIRLETEYAQGWAKGKRKTSKVEGVSDADVSAETGLPWGYSDWMVFAKKYWDEALLAWANFTPDGASVRIRILKVASLLVRCLMVHGRASDLERIAGKSSRDFPILAGGLKTFNEITTADGCMIPGPGTGKLRNDSPSCDPLKK